MTETKTGGLFLEDFTVGRTLVGPSRTITEADIAAFAAVSGDYNPLHVDEAFAKNTMFGQRIAHGLLGLSIATGLAFQAGLVDSSTLAFTGLTWKFKAPILIGDSISYRATVAKNRPLPSQGSGMVFLDVDLVNQNGVVVQTGQWSMLIKSRPTA
ncbi:MAG: MaoC/PaaZ C-terminal domain-containing protein [Anaerolineales bacterium]